MSEWAYTVIGTNVVIDCGTAEEAVAYERELWANQPYAPATPAPLDGTLTECPLKGVHEHAFRGPHRFREWEPDHTEETP